MTTTEHFADLIPGYRTVVADPPWPYKDAGREKSGMMLQKPLTNLYRNDGQISRGVAIRDYSIMSIEDICALPVKTLVAPAAHLYLWTTNSFMAEAHEVARAWGFVPKTIVTWVKVKATGEPSMKTGYYFRGATEHALFCVRGSLPPRTRQAIPTAFLHPRIQRHSEKPDAFFRQVVRPISYPRGLELFARRERRGWDAWGNQIEPAHA